MGGGTRPMGESAITNVPLPPQPKAPLGGGVPESGNSKHQLAVVSVHFKAMKFGQRSGSRLNVRIPCFCISLSYSNFFSQVVLGVRLPQV